MLDTYGKGPSTHRNADNGLDGDTSDVSASERVRIRIDAVLRMECTPSAPNAWQHDTKRAHAHSTQGS